MRSDGTVKGFSDLLSQKEYQIIHSYDEDRYCNLGWREKMVAMKNMRTSSVSKHVFVCFVSGKCLLEGWNS